MNNTLNKNLYKIFLSIIKYSSAIITLFILYLISTIFKFCNLHKIPLYYVTLNMVITMVDYYIGIPINTEILYRFYAIITGVFIIIYIWLIYKNRNNPKVDYIRSFCENYCG